MMEANQHAAHRRERRSASALINSACAALKRSQQLVCKGDLAAAVLAARLAERHTQLAERLLNLKAALRRIGEAHMQSTRRQEEHFAARDAVLKEREQKLYLAELTLERREQHSPPLDPEADRWRERLAAVRGAS